MKYIIKCPYCGTTYTVDVDKTEDTFMCKSCGGQNSTRHAIEKTEEVSDEIRKLAKTVQRQENLKRALNEELKESQEDVDEEYYYDRLDEQQKKARKKEQLIWVLVMGVFFLLYLIMALLNEPEEEDILLGTYGMICQEENFPVDKIPLFAYAVK